MAPGELDEVVGLQDHVVELEEGQRLLALEPQPHGVEAEHAVDREVAAVLAQERDVFEPVQPLGVVDGDGALGPAAELEEAREDALDAPLVGRDLLLAEESAGLVPAGGIADLAGAAAQEDDGLVAGLLQASEQHDRHQAADMEAVGGAVEADVGDDAPARGEGIEARFVGHLMHVSARRDLAQEVRTQLGHARQVPAALQWRLPEGHAI